MHGLEPWAEFFGTLLITKPSTLDPTISALFPQRPLASLLRDEPTMHAMTAVVRGMPSWNSVGPDSLPAELLSSKKHEFIQ